MTSYHLLTLAPLLLALVGAAAIDWRTRRIPNWLTFPLILSGLAQSLTAARTVSPTASALGLLLAGGLAFLMFALGAMGGGDVKLLAAIGAWVGPWAGLEVFAGSALVGMVMVLAQAAAHRRLPQLFKNSAVIAVNLAHVNRLGVEHVAEVGRAHSTMAWRVPKAVPILLAFVAVLAASSW
jgi:prepilin peptidase CpaA